MGWTHYEYQINILDFGSFLEYETYSKVKNFEASPRRLDSVCALTYLSSIILCTPLPEKLSAEDRSLCKNKWAEMKILVKKIMKMYSAEA